MHEPTNRLKGGYSDHSYLVAMNDVILSQANGSSYMRICDKMLNKSLFSSSKGINGCLAGSGSGVTEHPVSG